MSLPLNLSQLAIRSMARGSRDYLSKDVDELEVVEELKRTYRLERVYRFDVGKNTDGFSPLIHDVLETPELVHLMAGTLTEYPENHYVLLRGQLAGKHSIPENSFVFGAGLESVIDQICRAVFNPGDAALIPTPNFDVFESCTVRAGGDLVQIPVNNSDLLWNQQTIETVEQRIARGDIKLVWISNPVNPTGQFLPVEYIERLAMVTRKSGTFLVVDEAYGEYTDQTDHVASATQFIHAHPQLMVLRTFSKIYCLPSARVGYMASSCEDLREAVRTFRPMFPFSWISLYMAQLAILDADHVADTRRKLMERKRLLHSIICSPEAGLGEYHFLASDTNTIMFRHNTLSAEALHTGLARRGFLTANLNNLSGIVGQQYVRMTLHDSDTNDLFLQACAAVAKDA